MPESASLIGEYFGGTAAATEGTVAAEGAAGTAAAGGVAGGGALAGSVAGATTTGAVVEGGATLGGSLATAAETALATGLVSKALAPNAPQTKAPLGMPDPLAQEAARQKMIADAVQRRGRASTILTDSSGDKLGG